MNTTLNQSQQTHDAIAQMGCQLSSGDQRLDDVYTNRSTASPPLPRGWWQHQRPRWVDIDIAIPGHHPLLAPENGCVHANPTVPGVSTHQPNGTLSTNCGAQSLSIVTVRRLLLDRSYADPWAFRKPVFGNQSSVANIYGQARHDYYIRNGDVLPIPFDATEYELPAQEPNPEDVRKWLHENIVDTIFEYERSGRFTNKELFAIHRLWLDEWSLRRVAQEEGVKHQTIRERIEGNKHGQGGLWRKAPQFYRWWSFKHRRRREKYGHDGNPRRGRP